MIDDSSLRLYSVQHDMHFKGGSLLSFRVRPIADEESIPFYWYLNCCVLEKVVDRTFKLAGIGEEMWLSKKRVVPILGTTLFFIGG